MAEKYLMEGNKATKIPWGDLGLWITFELITRFRGKG